MWQQNHCGIYNTDNGGDEWKDVSGKEGYPNYGFALATDADPAKAWVIPVESDEQRIAPGLKLEVLVTEDFGQSWESVSQGLPDKCFDIVLRQAFGKKDTFLVFGTTNGNLYWANEYQMNWHLITHNLTKINLVTLV